MCVEGGGGGSVLFVHTGHACVFLSGLLGQSSLNKSTVTTDSGLKRRFIGLASNVCVLGGGEAKGKGEGGGGLLGVFAKAQECVRMCGCVSGWVCAWVGVKIHKRVSNNTCLNVCMCMCLCVCVCVRETVYVWVWVLM